MRRSLPRAPLHNRTALRCPPLSTSPAFPFLLPAETPSALPLIPWPRRPSHLRTANSLPLPPHILPSLFLPLQPLSLSPPLPLRIGPALDVDAGAAAVDDAAALSSPASGAPRIIVSKSSTLSASMFSKEEVLSPPTSAQQSSLSKELTESGLFRPTRPYSASANSSPSLPIRGVRDARDFSATGGMVLSSLDMPQLIPIAATAAAPTTQSALPVQSASSTASPAAPPASHRRTRSRGHTNSSSVSLVRVFPSVDRPPMQVILPIHCPVQRVLALVIAQYREEGRQPPLKFDTPDAYELRVLDDDDGTPDEDMPPLDRHRSIQEYGVDAAAFVEVADYAAPAAVMSPSQTFAQLKASAGQQAMERKMNATHPPPVQTGGMSSGLSSPPSVSSFSMQSGSRWDEVLSPRSALLPASSVVSNATSPSTSQPPTPTAAPRAGTLSPSLSRLKVSNGKIGLKVVLADMETHVLLVPADTRLEELLPLISRKKSSQMQPEHWKFLYPPSDDPDDLDLAPVPPRARSGSHAGQQQSGNWPQLSTSQAAVDSVLLAQAALHSRREQFSSLSAPELDMRMPVYALEQDELRLINKLDTPRRALPSQATSSFSSLSSHPSSLPIPVPSSRPVPVHRGHCVRLQRVPRGEDQPARQASAPDVRYRPAQGVQQARQRRPSASHLLRSHPRLSAHPLYRQHHRAVDALHHRVSREGRQAQLPRVRHGDAHGVPDGRPPRTDALRLEVHHPRAHRGGRDEHQHRLGLPGVEERHRTHLPRARPEECRGPAVPHAELGRGCHRHARPSDAARSAEQRGRATAPNHRLRDR